MGVTSLEPYATGTTASAFGALLDTSGATEASSQTLLMAQTTPTRAVGEAQVLQAWGNGQLVQVYTNQGTFQLRWRANEPAHYRQSDFLLFEAKRPIDLRRDATGNGPLANWPMGGDNRSPVRRAMDDVLERAEMPANLVEVPQAPGTPLSDNPFVRFYRGAGGAIRGLTGDAIEMLARIAPYIPEGNGMVMPMAITSEQQRALEQTRQLQTQTSQQAGNAVANFNDTLGFAMGLPPDSPEVTFGRIAIGVAEGVEGLVGIGRGAFSLFREGSTMRLAVRNTEILTKLANPNARQLRRVVDYIDKLSPDEYRAMPTQVKSALREGLQNHAGDAGALRATRRLDQLDGVTGTPTPTPTPRQVTGTTPSTQGGNGTLAVVNPNVAVVANYVQGIRNPLARQWVAFEANQRLAAGEVLDLNGLNRIQADVAQRLATNTRQQLAGATFSDPTLQAALRQRLSDRAGSDPSQNASLANSPQLVQVEAQNIALDHLDAGLFNGSGVPRAARDEFRSLALDWARQANPTQPALALEQLLARPEWQGTLLREVAIDQISGFSQRDLASLAGTAPEKARDLAELRLRVTSALDQGYSTAQSLKNLLATPGGSTRSRIVREAVVDQIGGASPLRTALKNHAINQGLGERQLVDLLTSPQTRLNTMRDALVRESVLEGGGALSPQQQGQLRQAIDQRLGTLRSQKEKESFLVALSNSPKLMGQMTAVPARSPELVAAATQPGWLARWQSLQQDNPSQARQIQAKSSEFGFSIEQLYGTSDALGIDPLSAATLLQARRMFPTQIDPSNLPRTATNQDQVQALYDARTHIPTSGLPQPNAGNGPGTIFKNEHDASMAALAHERALTTADPAFGEYSAYVYRRDDGTYGYTRLMRQGPGGGTLPSSRDVPAGGTIVAVTHSHPPNFVDQFSWADITTARSHAQHFPSTYVVHQNGTVDLYEPSSNRILRYGGQDSELQSSAPHSGTPPPTENTLTLPPEFWDNAVLDRAALSERHGFNAAQIDALEAMRPMRGELSALTSTRFDSKEQAAAGAYALVERLYERTPALRESLELGGQIYRDGQGGWRVSLPVVSPSNTSVGVGSVPDYSAPVATDSFFWHTHPSSLPGRGHASGFSFADMTTALQSNRGMFVYQNGRAYLMEVGSAWNSLPPAQRQARVSRMTEQADIVRSPTASQPDRDAALGRLRDLVRQTPITVTVFDRTGGNTSAGSSINVFPVSLWTQGGALELLPNRSPVRQLPATPTDTSSTPTPRSPLLINQPDVSFELRPQSTDGRTLIVLPDTHGRDDLQQRAFDYLRSAQDWVFGDNTVVVSLGDTIDKGPNSAQNVEALINRDQEPGISQVVTHIGNHELWLTEWLANPEKLKYAHDWIANRGGAIALQSYDRFARQNPQLSSFSLDGIDLKNMPVIEQTGARGTTTVVPDNTNGFYTRLYDRIIEGLPRSHLDFFSNLQPSTRIGDYFFSHAGADPSRPLDDQGLGALTWIRDPYLRFDGQWIGDPNTVTVSGHTVLRQPLIQENKFALDLGTFMTGDFMAAILQNDLVRFAIFRADAEPVWTDIRGGFDQGLFAPRFDPSLVIKNPKKPN